MSRYMFLLLFSILICLHGNKNDKCENNLNITVISKNEIRLKSPEELIINFFELNGCDIDEKFQFECMDTYLCHIDNDTKIGHVKLNHDDNYTTNISIKLHPTFIGLTHITVKPLNNTSNLNITLNNLITIHKTKGEIIWQTIFSGVVSCFIFFVTFLMGTQLNINTIIEILKKPIGVIVSITCQFLFMPIVAYLLCITILKEEPNFVKFCFIATGSSPGGGKSSFWTIIFDGNLDLSVCLTFVQTVCASFMMPLWMKVFGENFLSKENISLPYMGLIKAILNLIIPCFFGMLTVYYKPQLVRNAQKYIKTATWISTIIFTALGVFVYYHIFLMITIPILIASCILPWSGYIVAFFLSKLCKLPLADAITISIETGIQNVGLAIMMLMYSFKEPELDIAMVAPVVVILATDKPLVIIWLVKKFIKNYKEKKETKNENIPLS